MEEKMEEKQEALGIYSDIFKDLYGARPSLERMAEWPLPEIWEAVNSVSSQLDEELGIEQPLPTSGEGWSLITPGPQAGP